MARTICGQSVRLLPMVRAGALLPLLLSYLEGAALGAEGLPAERIDLVKPADATDEAAVLSAARRVEIIVTGG